MECRPSKPGEHANPEATLKEALEMLQRLRGERNLSVEALYARYFKHDEVSFSSVKRFLSGKRPSHPGTTNALLAAAKAAWGDECRAARLYDSLVEALALETDQGVERYDGCYRSCTKSTVAQAQVRLYPALIGPCSRCGRPLFRIVTQRKGGDPCGYVFNMGRRICLFSVQKDYIAMAMLHHVADPLQDALSGILLYEAEGEREVKAARIALVHDLSELGKKDDGQLSEMIKGSLVNETAIDGVLTGWSLLTLGTGLER
jgi:hypothetical protein